AAIRTQYRHDDPTGSLDANLALAGQAAVADELDETARAVAALPDLAAVGIENPVAEVDVGTRRRFDDQHLVAADAEAPVGERAQLRGVEIDVLRNAVEHDEIVAEAVHLGEAQSHYLGGARSWAPGNSPLRRNGSSQPFCT